MRDRLIELLEKSPRLDAMYGEYDVAADWLIEHGVVVLDMGVVSPENRPLITHIAGRPLNEVADLINRLREIEKRWNKLLTADISRNFDQENTHFSKEDNNE